jgi:hypothetical protein
MEMMGASDDQVLVRKSQTHELWEKEFETVEKEMEDGTKQEILIGRETNEPLTDEDGNQLTRDHMFDCDNYLAMRATAFNVEDTLRVEFDWSGEREVWDISVSLWSDPPSHKFQKSSTVAEIPEDWTIKMMGPPEDVNCRSTRLVIEVPEPDADDEEAELTVTQI